MKKTTLDAPHMMVALPCTGGKTPPPQPKTTTRGVFTPSWKTTISFEKKTFFEKNNFSCQIKRAQLQKYANRSTHFILFKNNVYKNIRLKLPEKIKKMLRIS